MVVERINITWYVVTWNLDVVPNSERDTGS